MKQEHFTSRWGLIISVVGIAVGTGNIWRFPRIAAANGGGAFLIPWVIFLFVWSIPLIMAEFAIGKKARYGVVGAFASLMGPRFAWMGAFVGLVAVAIMFYYSVVAGWCLRYFSSAATGKLLGIEDHEAFWETFIGSGWQPVLFHFLATTAGILIVQRGVVKGIEKANRVLVPTLLALIIVSAIRAISLPGAINGLNFLFTPDFGALTDVNLWLQALTQNAWDTGAGWGLILTYAIYMRKQEDVPLNAAMIGFGNNSVSLLAAITVFCTVFALLPAGEASQIIQTPGPANTGLTFIWIPQLFAQMPGGYLFAGFFFLALTFAALSSLISMFELATRILMDLKLTRTQAIRLVYLATLLFGLPSALSVDFFLNQDWTWGVALMLSGLFVALLAIRFGVKRFRQDLINETGDIQVGRWYDLLIKYAIPVQVVVLVSWWFSQVAGADWWNPFRQANIGTCLFQWGLAIAVLLVFNRFLSERTLRS